jgi:RNA polymerase sigma factor (sigma-70 family)
MAALDLEAAFRAHAHIVLRRARQILGTVEADEVVQDVFVALAERPEQFEERSSLVTYLYAVTTHACLNRLRNRRKRQGIVDEKLAPGIERATQPRGEVISIVRDLLARVPEDMATAAVHYFVDEMTHDEIAQMLGCSRRHVGDLVERFRKFAEEGS